MTKKENKYLGINVTRDIQNLCYDNYKTPWKTKKEKKLNKWRDILYLTQYVKMSILSVQYLNAMQSIELSLDPF